MNAYTYMKQVSTCLLDIQINNYKNPTLLTFPIKILTDGEKQTTVKCFDSFYIIMYMCINYHITFRIFVSLKVHLWNIAKFKGKRNLCYYKAPD